MSRSRGLESRLALARILMSTLWHRFSDSGQNLVANRRNRFIERYGETDNYLCQMLR